MKKIFLIIISIFIIFSCSTTKEINDIDNNEEIVNIEKEILTSDQLPFPSLMNVSKQKFEPILMVNGFIKEISEDELGLQKIVVSTIYYYYYLNEIIKLEYNLVYGGMEKVYVNEGKYENRGLKLGVASENSYLTAYYSNLDNFMIRMSNDKPVKYNDIWYYSPSWLVSGNTAWMSFRPINNFNTALNGYYNRWILEESKIDDYEIHHYDNLDRIRFKIKLNSYPEYFERNESIFLVEEAYYGNQEIFVLKSEYEEFKIKDYKIGIYWQTKFNEYLSEEYTLGDDLFVYGSIYAFDHINKEILVCVRDFSLISDEELIEKKINDLE